MSQCIHLYGSLTKDVLVDALGKFRRVASGEGPITFVIDSDEGDLDSAVRFVNCVRFIPIKKLVRVCNAGPVASFIVIAISDETEIRTNAELRFGCDRDKAGNSETTYRAILYKTLSSNKYGQKKLREFNAKGSMRLSADESLKMEIAKRVF